MLRDRAQSARAPNDRDRLFEVIGDFSSGNSLISSVFRPVTRMSVWHSGQMITTSSLLLPDEPCLFFGYRNSAKDDARDIYHSISHWQESEKFRLSDEILREAVLQSANPIEARKLAARHQDKWRIDWRSIRARTLKTGFMMAAEQNINVRLRMEQFAKNDAS
ncbi:hypothetical protein ACFS07_35545 [Undibacterium arcticum]